MNIALDYDDTYTADKILWDSFIVNAKKRSVLIEHEIQIDIWIDDYPCGI